MTQQLQAEGIRVPQRFATTADAYRSFVADNGLEAVIEEHGFGHLHIALSAAV